MSAWNETKRWTMTAAACAVALSAACGLAMAPGAGDGDELGPPVPEFHLSTLDGRQLGPSDFKGKVVLYEFWATWCTPCHVQAEILKNLHAEAAKNGVEFVGISSGEPADVVRAYVAKKPFSYPVLLDPDDSLSGPLEILALPTLIVTGRDGAVVWRHTGLTDTDTLRQAFAAAKARPHAEPGERGSAR